MMINERLEEDEVIEMEIVHKKHLPYRLEDFVRSLVFVGFIIVGITSITFDGFISIGSVLILGAVIYIPLPLYMRWRKLQPIRYYITNKRLIIYDSIQNSIKHSFTFTSFPEVTMHEKANNSGFLILGEKQELLRRGRGLFSMKVLVNLTDHKIVLENIPDVREVYNLIKSKLN